MSRSSAALYSFELAEPRALACPEATALISTEPPSPEIPFAVAAAPARPRPRRLLLRDLHEPSYLLPLSSLALVHHSERT